MCSPDTVPGGRDRAVERHKPGPKPDLSGKAGSSTYQMYTRHGVHEVPWPHVALLSTSVRDDDDALWRTAQIHSAPLRSLQPCGETSPGGEQGYGFSLL